MYPGYEHEKLFELVSEFTSNDTIASSFVHWMQDHASDLRELLEPFDRPLDTGVIVRELTPTPEIMAQFSTDGGTPNTPANL